jgi:hypothetical protein
MMLTREEHDFGSKNTGSIVCALSQHVRGVDQADTLTHDTIDQASLIQFEKTHLAIVWMQVWVKC